MRAPMSSPQFEPGTVLLGRYELLSLLGEGGFGQVYEGQHRRTGQRVAIKVLKARWAEDHTQLARFQREMQLCARLYHPHIVRLIDSGHTESGQLFTVFDLVPGRTLAQVLAEQGALPPREVAHLMGQVLDALSCAHQLGIIHRDLKPQNIILTRTGTRRHALVLDFGLGTLAKEARREDFARLTRNNELLGTPAYAAPELLRGQEARPGTDLYAWGLIFLECLSGQRVIRGDSLPQVLYQQLGPEPVPLPEPLRGGRLGLLLERVLAKDVRERDVPVAELLEALEDWSQQVPLQPPQPAAPRQEPEPEATTLTSTQQQLRPLYGRAQELALLQQRWWQAVQGRGQAVLVLGEPGIGKSRLAQELGWRLQGMPHTWLQCRCLPESRHSVLRPVVELLERLLGHAPQAPAAERLAALQALVERLGLEPAQVLAPLAALLELPPPESAPQRASSPQRHKELLLEALLNVLYALAEQQPVLLVVEDLHWADATTLELLGHLVQDVSTARLLALLTTRPEAKLPRAATKALHVRLGPLEPEPMEQLVAGLSSERPLPAEVVHQVVQRAEGVPLFAEALTRMVLESDSLRMKLLQSLPVPSTLQALLQVRLERLGPARDTAQLASALGREFSEELLRAVSPRAEEQLQRDLATLVVADLVHRQPGSHRRTWLFKHALIRDTAYASLTKAARVQAHARIAAVLEERFPEVVRTRPDLLAWHHAAAEQKQQALAYARQAATAALGRSAPQQALECASEALAWLESVEDGRERARLELALHGVITPALASTRGWADSGLEAHMERSQQLVEALGEDSQALPALWALVLYHLTRGHQAPLQVLVPRLLALAGEDVDRQVAVLPLVGHYQAVVGQLAQARESQARVLELYSAERHGAYAQVYGLDMGAWAGMSLSHLEAYAGRMERALTLAREALEQARRSQHPSTVAVAYVYLLMVHYLRGEREAVRGLAVEARELVEEQRLPTQGAHCALLLGWAEQDREGMLRHLALLEDIGFGMGLAFYTSLVAAVEAAQGLYPQAIARLEAAERRARASGELFYLPEVLLMRGRCLHAGFGPATGAEGCLREALELSQRLGMGLMELRSAVALERVLREQGRPSELRPLLVEGMPSEECLPELAEARALLG